MATHSSILAWTEEPGGLWSMGSQRVGHDWATNTHTTYQVLPTALFCETDKKQSNKPIYHTITINIRKVTGVDGGNRICLITRRSKMLCKNYLSPGNWDVKCLRCLPHVILVAQVPLDQGLQTFCKEPDSNYFRLCEPCAFCCNHLASVAKAWRQPSTMGDLGCASVKLYLQKTCSGLGLANGLLILGLDSLPIIYGSLAKGHTGNDFLRPFVQQQQNFRVGKVPGLGRSPREGNS